MRTLKNPIVLLKMSVSPGWLGRVALLFSLLGLGVVYCACSDGDGNTKTEKGVETASLQKVEGAPVYSIDAINSQPVPKAGPIVINAATTPAIVIGGWAVDAPAKNAAGGVFLNVDGKSDLTATYGADRQDVASVLKEPNYKMSGFGISIPTASLDKGRHTLGLKVLTADKKGYYEPSQKIAIDIE